MKLLWDLILVGCILTNNLALISGHGLSIDSIGYNEHNETISDKALLTQYPLAFEHNDTTLAYSSSADDSTFVTDSGPYSNEQEPGDTGKLEDIIAGVGSPSGRYFDPYRLYLNKAHVNTCLLDGIKATLMWWTFPNGTLRTHNSSKSYLYSYIDLSYKHFASDEALYYKLKSAGSPKIAIFSAAHNNLTSVPRRTLEYLSKSLKYLTLAGNTFHTSSSENHNSDSNQNMSSVHGYLQRTYSNGTLDDALNGRRLITAKQSGGRFYSKGERSIAWAMFPQLPLLVELDLSNCQIEHLSMEAFANVSNLKSLYLSHNKMLTIPFDTFYHTPMLKHLDLSYTNVFESQVSLPTLEAVINMIYGLKIQQTTFKYLPNIEYLDLSHTKLTRNSAVAFAHLGQNLKYLSLCHTAFPMIGNALLKNTALVGLDLSGNTYAAYNIIDDAFEGVADTLKILYFERSNLKDISWIRSLRNLVVLGLAGNNINSVGIETFSPLHSLQLLDLSANHVGNWYQRVFTNNKKMRLLNLRDNNINIVTSEMLKDFSLLDYLSLGYNDFVCDCALRALVDMAAVNREHSECKRKLGALQVAGQPSDLMDKLTIAHWPLYISNISSVMIMQSLERFKFVGSTVGANAMDKRPKKKQYLFKFYHRAKFAKRCLQKDKQLPSSIEKLNVTSLSLQLLDYQEDQYWCFNETEKLSLTELTCQQRSFTEDIADQLHNLTICVISIVCSLLGISTIGVIIYFKRWHIYYYYSSLKSAALLSEAAKENMDKLSVQSPGNTQMLYDIFISYCQDDRHWVLEQLVPNIEESGDIAICLHERDFEIGVTILDNIISCMDKSRALMLIISSSFLLSQWCQFEMHLAQHRIFDINNDQLILVLLEDIPRNKRPKNLQYMMDVKTYIKWPDPKSKDCRVAEQKVFWKRLRRALNNICT